MKSSQRVTVIIPCRNEKIFIRDCMDSVLANDFPHDRLEVLVVDGMSDDGTREILNEYVQQCSFIRVIDNKKKIQSVAINIGISLASGEVIVRMDAHSRYPVDYISKCLKAMSEYNADNVGGCWHGVPRVDTAIGRSIVEALSHPFGVGNASYRYAQGEQPKWVDAVPFFCMRKNFLQKIGPFNEKIGPTEDMEFNKRILRSGGKILLVPEIVVDYYTRSDMKSFLKHNWRNGLWAILPFEFADGVPISWRHLVPLVFVSSLLGSIVLAVLVPQSWPLVASIGGSYALLNLMASIQVGIRKRSVRSVFLVPLMFFVLHTSYGIGSIAGVIQLTVRSLGRILAPKRERVRHV